MSEDVPAPSEPRRRVIGAVEVRRRMLEAATLTVRRTGVRLGLEELSLEAVIVAAGVPRSSAYRIWPNKADFIRDLLVHLADPAEWTGAAAFDPQAYALAESMLGSAPDLAGPEARRAVLLDVVRQVVRHNREALAASDAWRVYTALLATVRSLPEPDQRALVAVAVHRSESVFVTRLAEFVEQFATALGYRVRPGLTFRQFAVAASSMMESLIHRWNLSEAVGETADDLRDTLAAPIPGSVVGRDPDEEWTLEAVAYLALVDAFVEPVPS